MSKRVLLGIFLLATAGWLSTSALAAAKPNILVI